MNPGIVDWLFAGLLYLAVAVLFVGTGRKIWIYSRVPAPYKIPVTPAPTSRAGVVLRMLREIVLFESLFKADKWTWLFGWLFHAGMLVVLLRHLRFLTDPVWGWVAALDEAAVIGGYAMLFGLSGLLVRRVVVDRVRYISTPSDYLMLLLILALAGSGLLMQQVWHTDIVALKTFTLGLEVFSIGGLPRDPILLLHLVLAISLIGIFPISKLLHAPGLFFSPTRNQVDNPRERRHGGGAGQ